MDFEFSPEEKTIIQKVRVFIEAEATPEMLEETLSIGYCYGGELGRGFIKKKSRSTARPSRSRAQTMQP